MSSTAGETASGAKRHPALAIERVRKKLRSRYAAERYFHVACVAAIVVALMFLSLLFITVVGKGYSAFRQSFIALDIYFDPAIIDPTGDREPGALAEANYSSLVRRSLYDLFPEVTSRGERRMLGGLVSDGAAFELQRRVIERPALIGQTLRLSFPTSDDADMLLKGVMPRDSPESQRRLSDAEIAWIDQLAASGAIERRFHTRFFTSGDSREPELAGVWGAAVGSFYILLVTLLLSFPLGVAAAVYLEEFARKSWITDLIEVNINNLAAVPSIVFGLLGLAVFLNLMHLPRSASLVGGLVLTLMTMPNIIIPARAAIRSVPPSIREAAYGLGASPLQVTFHHVLPLALPGILTGTIIGMSQALGETAPLLMIGMVAFVVDVPTGILEPATALPVQIYLWADSPERAFVEKTSAAILVLLAFLVAMNIVAVIVRKRTETRW